MTSIRLSDVSKIYSHGRNALEGLSLDVNAGELFVLLGPSGSGKTTLLRLIAGLDVPTSGEIWFGDRRVDRLPAARRNIAMAFQEPTLYPHWTVRQHLSAGPSGFVGLVGRWVGLNRPSSGKRRTDTSRQREVVGGLDRTMLGKLGLEPLFNRKPHQLSGGERQRVALGRAIVREPAAFLFDEPFSNLDVRTRWELRRELKDVQQALGRTTIFVTHDQAEAFAMADRMAVLDEGVLRQVGHPSEVYDRPCDIRVAQLTGDPPMNLWPGILSSHSGEWCLKSDIWSGKFDLPSSTADTGEASFETVAKTRADSDSGEQAVWVGVRPEGLAWGSENTSDSSETPQRGFKAILESVDYLGQRWVLTVRPCTVANRGIASQGGDASQSGELTTETIQISTGQEPPQQPGAEICLSCRAKDIHLFDRRSGRRL